MKHRFKILVLAVICLAFSVPEVPYIHVFSGVTEAHAQQKKKRRTLFDVLFKRRNKKKRNIKSDDTNARKATTKKRKRRNNNRVAGGTSRSTKPAKPTVVAEKSENAAKILVVGDFLGSSTAKGLVKLYAANPNIVVVNKANSSSGLVRDDVVDWPNVIPALIEEHKPIAVVALVGMNDRQQMRLSTGRVEKFSEAWLAEYNARVTKIVNVSPERQIPFVWMGLPPVRSNRMNTDYLVLNEIYRGKVEAIGGNFVDVWDGFTNAEGKFVSAGPDINGQIVRLRGPKGITMTRAGRTKLAFFADKALRKIGVVGSDQEFQYTSLGTINLNAAQKSLPEYNPAADGRTPVISLASPASDGGDILDGEEDFLKSDENKNSVSFDLVEKGLVYEPKNGRIDAQWGTPATKPAKTEKPEKEGETEKTEGEKTSSLIPPTNTTISQTQSANAAN
ncbi:MAG: SGNH family hydrolase [Pseudomonadota bacterium]